MIEKKGGLTWKIGFNTPSGDVSTPETPSGVFSLRRCENRNLNPGKPISHLPGLNPDCEYVAKQQQKEFRSYRSTNATDYVRLCRQGGRRELLHYTSTPVIESKLERPISLSVSSMNHSKHHRNSRPQTEIPLIDQILSKRENPTNCRSELQPVDNKAKLYFAYNRSSGTITRVIATSPRPFKFGKK